MAEPERASRRARRIARKAGKMALVAAFGVVVRWAVTALLGRIG